MKHPIPIAIFLVTCGYVNAQAPDSAQIYFQKAIEYKTTHQYLLASKNLDKALVFNKNYVAAYVENGYMNLEMRKTDNALSNFAKAFEIDPANTTAAKELMEIYYNYRQYAKAKAIAVKCSSCQNAEKIVAMCNYQAEDYGSAIKGLSNYLAKNPTDAEATYTLARSYLDMEQYKSAVPYYTKAILLNPEKNTWTYELGMLYYTLNDFKNAVVYFNKASENGYPQKNDFIENLGYAYIYSGQFNEGEKLLLGLIEKKPGDTELLRDIAEAYYNGKLYDKSLSYCQKLMELDAKDGKALYQAGLCFQKKGQKDKGQSMCDKAIEMDPSLNSMRQKQNTMGL
jgi:tetratricopeptide (TPR) repeat protein